MTMGGEEGDNVVMCPPGPDDVHRRQRCPAIQLADRQHPGRSCQRGELPFLLSVIRKHCY